MEFQIYNGVLDRNLTTNQIIDKAIEMWDFDSVDQTSKVVTAAIRILVLRFIPMAPNHKDNIWQWAVLIGIRWSKAIMLCLFQWKGRAAGRLL